MTPSSNIETLRAILSALRTPRTGCAWDLAQTHASLVPYVLEEAYEVVDAIQRGDHSDLCDELGDLLLQVVFHSHLAEEEGSFAFDDVVRAITAKMIRRHPQVFAPEEQVPAAFQRTASWEEIKAAERAKARPDAGPARVLAGVPFALPGLTRAVKLQSKASRVGFDWDDARLVLEKIREEIDEIAVAMSSPEPERTAAMTDEIGDLFFAVANLARHAGVDPDVAVRGTNIKFERRFAFIEDRLAERGSAPDRSTLEEMDHFWKEAKKAGL